MGVADKKKAWSSQNNGNLFYEGFPKAKDGLLVVLRTSRGAIDKSRALRPCVGHMGHCLTDRVVSLLAALVGCTDAVMTQYWLDRSSLPVEVVEVVLFSRGVCNEIIQRRLDDGVLGGQAL